MHGVVGDAKAFVGGDDNVVWLPVQCRYSGGEIKGEGRER